MKDARQKATDYSTIQSIKNRHIHGRKQRALPGAGECLLPGTGFPLGDESVWELDSGGGYTTLGVC